MKRLVKVHFIAFALLIMLTPLLACGGAETPPPPPPAGNQAPVINSLTAEAPTIIPNAETRVTCDAIDPDGDELTYTWTTTAGTITETYKTFIFWKAPNFVGESTVSVTVDDGKNGIASRSCTITVLADQLPVIDSVTAEPTTLKPEETSTVTCTASDPDGDELTYTWSASGGTVSGVGKIITWKAPAVTGEFLINVKVDDGKGGTVEGSCRIVVAIPATTAILLPLTGESGSIYYDGTLITQFKIGDNAKNVGVRPYLSFDVSGLTGAEIKEAKLIFTIKQTVGNPWFTPPYLYAEIVKYGARPLQPADFHSVLMLGELKRYDSTPPTEINVRSHLTDTIKWREPRFQVRLRLATDSNLNKQDDYIEFSKVELAITYVK